MVGTGVCLLKIIPQAVSLSKRKVHQIPLDFAVSILRYAGIRGGESVGSLLVRVRGWLLYGGMGIGKNDGQNWTDEL